VLWRPGNDERAERCKKCGKRIIGLKRERLEATPVFHLECLPRSPTCRSQRGSGVVSGSLTTVVAIRGS
jgi:hypothetical protein